VCCWQPHSPAT